MKKIIIYNILRVVLEYLIIFVHINYYKIIPFCVYLLFGVVLL